MARIEALALTYAVTGDGAYAAAARRFIGAWARVNVPTGRPIDETTLEPLIVGYDLTRATFAPEARDSVDAWLRLVATRELASRAPGKKTATNNWQSHRVKTAGLIAMTLHDAALTATALDAARA